MMIDEAVYQRVVRPRLPPLRVQTRLYIGIVAFIACLLLIFVGIFSPLIVLRNMDKSYEAEMRYIEYTLASKAVAPYRVVMFEAFAISQALEGYVMSRMQVLPNLSAPPLERIEGQNFTNFDDISVTLRRNMTMIAMTALQPGGVYAFFSPCNATKYGRDTLDPKDNAQNFKPTPFETILGGRAVYVGPFRYTSGVLQGHWGLAIRRPIYNRTSYKSADIHTFWGFALTLVNISGLIERNPFAFISLTTKKRDVDYLLSVHNETSGAITILATSLKQPTATQLAEFVRLGTSVGITPNHPFLITIRGRDYGSNLSPANIIIVVSTVLSGLLAIFAAVIAAVLWCTATHDTAAHAPKMAPFAMLTIGPCRGEELWDLASDQMVEVTERLGHVLARQMVRHHAYQIQQVHPLTTSYVTRSVAAAVKMAFSTIEELQRHPIDGPLRAVLGDEVRLLLSYAVHWCTDAAVRVESLEGTYRYEGPDVVYGGRMWAFAAPSVVTASEAVVQTLPCFGLRNIDTRPCCVVNVVRSRTLCGATGGKSATIYMPHSLPTTAQATAGVQCGKAVSPTAAPLESNSGTENTQPLPPQQLFTLLDTRRPALVAAEAAAPRNVDSVSSASCPSDSAEIPAMNLLAGECAVLPVLPSSAADGDSAKNAEMAIAARTSTSSDAPTESESNDILSASSLSVAPPLSHASSSSDIGVSNGATTAVRLSSLAFQGDAVTRALLQPLIPRALDVALRVAFDYQSITLDVRYAEVRVLVYYFYSSCKILFRPLAAPERHNIFRRLVTAFGVPQQGILEHLAARCVIRYVQQRLKSRQFAPHDPHLRVTPREAPRTLNTYAKLGRATR
ncbi:conserved hypothetical protein [Leishmania major strain Friedlin]|uniref:CHASE domain-containing protein n=1 Tax=Leishmania major TaxID=5664 RepID=Q4QHZ3_LEIMA|nr:conserved hypothetical protein [Leishmania major strain Friedlin]CAG9569640.1 hypothetical_protein_-__conserved [Leishmania major strain Friedlin]CAJ02443.1 conserved hypothetical protein [Leishmania major strain Friedlin]|eukprot:XP_001681205.1 conserved hypothetical protein [Leishmania major strain Friedlin]